MKNKLIDIDGRTSSKTRPCGLDCHNARLNPEIVRWIRENRTGLSAKAQAKRLGVHYRTVEKVRYFESWRHVI